MTFLQCPECDLRFPEDEAKCPDCGWKPEDPEIQLEEPPPANGMREYSGKVVGL